MTWRCSWQDYRGWPWMANQRHPDVKFEDFETRELADRRAKHLRKQGMTVCVAPAPIPRVKKPASKEKFNANWRMAP